MGQEYIKIEGFGNIIICAQLQAQHFIQFAPARGEQNDGNAHFIAQLAQGFQPVHARHFYICQDDVKM